MTVDLLPSPSSAERAHWRPSADGSHLLCCVPAGPQDGWARIEQDCPYCCGPETD